MNNTTTSIEWIRHANNFQMVFPEKCAIAIWISASEKPMVGFVYGLSVYAGGRLVYDGIFQSFEEAEKGTIAWLETLQGQIKEALSSEAEKGAIAW